MAYSDKVLDHYENPRNVGSFDKDDDDVGTGMVGAPACGDVMKLQIKVGARRRHRGREVQDLRLRLGDRIVSSLVTEWVKGKTLDQALTIKNTQIAEELALPPVKIHCSILAEDAIKAAVADYKHEARRGSDGRRRRRSAACAAMTCGRDRTRHGNHADRKSGAARQPLYLTQARQGRRPAPRRAHHRLLGPGVQARVCRRSRARGPACSRATA